MKKIGFIGAYDKTDLIIYIAKILTVLNQKVLVVDATTNQKARYVVPVINPTTAYVTEYEDIDIAVGFSNINNIKRYLGISDDQEMEYNFILIPRAICAGGCLILGSRRVQGWSVRKKPPRRRPKPSSPAWTS